MTLADDAVGAIAPWHTVDYETFTRAIWSMASDLELFANDVLDDDGNVLFEGWTTFLDPDLCPAAGLPYLAQWVGERLPAGLTEAAQRQWIKDAPNQFRGTPQSIARAAQRWLTGSKLVMIRERSRLDLSTNTDYIAIQTFTAETPSPALVLAELRTVVPADITIDFQTVTGSTWANVAIGFASWGALAADSASWADVFTTAGFVSFPR